jgi:gluconolactonase
MLRWVSDPAASWEPLTDAGDACQDLAVDPRGEVFFHDRAKKTTRRVAADGTISDATMIPPLRAIAFTTEGHPITVQDFDPTCLTTTNTGYVYATDATAGKVWLIKPDGARSLLDENLKQPAGIVLSPDGLWLAVIERASHIGYSYRVKTDGTVEAKQRFYWLHVPDDADDSGAGDAVFDRDGRLFVATRMGVQVLDRNGRSRAILPLPAVQASSICFGGEQFDQLFAISGHRLYRRHMKAVGAPSFLSPIKLPGWGAG